MTDNVTPIRRPLPPPDSEELISLLNSNLQQMLYGLLYRRRSSPPTLAELYTFATYALGSDHKETDRRLGELQRFFKIETSLSTNEQRYLLVGWSDPLPSNVGSAMSLRRRAEVLSSQRCAMCGRTPLRDSVRLVVDHKIPQAWGGGNEPENLQPLCEECSVGKRDYFQTYDPFADKIRKAITYDEPQRRIGELLLAFDGQWVRSDLLGIVASAKEYQEDWQRRLRDLRFLGWDYTYEKRYNEGSRVWTYYRLTKSRPWPDNIATAIKEETERRDREKAAIRQGGATAPGDSLSGQPVSPA